jgi:hypothetical protein
MNYFAIENESTNTNLVTGRVLTAKDFFTDENSEGYFSKKEFQHYGSTLIRNERNDLAGFIEELKRGTKVNMNLIVRKDRSNRPYCFPQFFFARGVKGYKIIVNDEILRFINDYAEGKITVNFSLLELGKVSAID